MADVSMAGDGYDLPDDLETGAQGADGTSPPAAEAHPPAAGTPAAPTSPVVVDFPDPEPRNGVPADRVAERAVLAAVITEPVRSWPWVSTLDLDAFHYPAHRAIYAAMRRLAAEGGAYGESLSVRDEVMRSGELTEEAASRSLGGILAGYVRSTDVEHHVRLLQRQQRRRRILTDASTIVRTVRTADDAALEAATAAAHASWSELRSADVTLTDMDHAAPEHPSWLVRDLLPSTGLAMLWAPPNAGKTYLLLRTVHELLQEPQPTHLWGHPKLEIEGTVRRALWVATEETAGRLKARSLWVEKGAEFPRTGELRHVFAADASRRVTLEDLPSILSRYGPFDVVVLDSLTGLRPKTVDGERVRWDVDNDAANAMCLMLRGLCEQHRCCVVLVHHTGRDVTKGYRGPTDWWASVDVMFGLEAHKPTQTVKVLCEKNRDGTVLPDFHLKPTWEHEAYGLTYEGETVTAPLTENENRAIEILRQFDGRATQKAIRDCLGCSPQVARNTAASLVNRGLAIYTGRSEHRSPELGLAEMLEE